MGKDLFELVTAEHREVTELLTTLRTTAHGLAESRARLFEQLRSLVQAHASAEEVLLYPALGEPADGAGGDGAGAEKLRAEHREAQQILDRLAAASVTSEEFDKGVRELGNALAAHVEKEEREGFARIRARCDQAELDRLARMWEQRRAASLHGMAPAPATGGRHETEQPRA